MPHHPSQQLQASPSPITGISLKCHRQRSLQHFKVSNRDCPLESLRMQFSDGPWDRRFIAELQETGIMFGSRMHARHRKKPKLAAISECAHRCAANHSEPEQLSNATAQQAVPTSIKFRVVQNTLVMIVICDCIEWKYNYWINVVNFVDFDCSGRD